MIRTPLCDLIGIRYPVFQGGMAHVSDGRLAAAVSEAGGLGIISAMNYGGTKLRDQIREARSLTAKPIGVNIMLQAPTAADSAAICAEEKVEIVTTGAGNPAEFMPLWLDAGIRVIPVVASAAMAKIMQRAGASAVIAEGGESGGHIGEAATMPLVPQVVDAVSIPVIAAGGIADGRGLAAALMLGAAGVQMGMRRPRALQEPHPEGVRHLHHRHRAQARPHGPLPQNALFPPLRASRIHRHFRRGARSARRRFSAPCGDRRRRKGRLLSRGSDRRDGQGRADRRRDPRRCDARRGRSAFLRRGVTQIRRFHG